MVKSSKKSNQTALPEGGSPAPDSPAASTPDANTAVTRKVQKAKSAKVKQRPKTAGKRARVTAGETVAARKPRAARAAHKTRRAEHVGISDEDIRIRAYFISEQRKQSGVPGDSAHDWLDARRQLQEEAGKNA